MSVPAATVLRWTARIASAASPCVLLAFATAGRAPVAQVHAALWVGLLFFPVGVVLGLALAWRREALGAAVALGSLAAFYIVYGVLLQGQLPRGPWFAVFTSPALLFLASWLSRNWGERRAGFATRGDR
jgi:hypothetical protein